MDQIDARKGELAQVTHDSTARIDGLMARDMAIENVSISGKYSRSPSGALGEIDEGKRPPKYSRRFMMSSSATRSKRSTS